MNQKKYLSDYITDPSVMSDCCKSPVYQPKHKAGWVEGSAKCLGCYEFCKPVKKEGEVSNLFVLTN